MKSGGPFLLSESIFLPPFFFFTVRGACRALFLFYISMRMCMQKRAKMKEEKRKDSTGFYQCSFRRKKETQGKNAV
ncbi:hypothetical protein DRA42_12280 [Ethanoligenens harbinense]|nr:hypothetical protein CXQ68_12245 [Ethanoligenens harbinense YUAN-3]AYF39570.1 hypothetical protein CXP51_12140 [Ethanoligenens harbinense]AYF42396.1 hypothetical protein CN246_12690 [Ethanoligenens harbinense]QCN93149.1 hypothetical protein DRA42_12280 [Ethanoligenens harbinense]